MQRDLGGSGAASSGGGGGEEFLGRVEACWSWRLFRGNSSLVGFKLPGAEDFLVLKLWYVLVEDDREANFKIPCIVLCE